MHFTQAGLALLLVATTLALPVPQLAGEGSACDSILADTDNGIGYGIENAENNIAGTISHKGRRQLAGEGAACNSLLADTDNGVGYGIENAENNIAANIAGAPKGAPKAPARRQLDKISNGFQAVSSAAGTGDVTAEATTELDSIDGASTDGAAQLGAEVGSTEEGTLEGIGKAVPKRQLDKISNGFQAVSSAAGTGDLTVPATTGLDGIDGTSTDGAAQLGAEVGSAEEGTLEAAGSSVP